MPFGSMLHVLHGNKVIFIFIVIVIVIVKMKRKEAPHPLNTDAFQTS